MLRRTIAFVLVCLVLCLVLEGGSAMAAAPNDPVWSDQWHLRTIHADTAWSRSKGSGVVVAVVDTGVDLNHVDLQGRLVPGADLVDHDSDPMDEQGHGTFMAGLIAAHTGNGEGVASVAPLAKLMPIRALKSDGTGDPDTVADGINEAVRRHANVINLSLAVESTNSSGSSNAQQVAVTASLRLAITNASNKGVFVAIAAGNDFDNGGHPTTAYTSTGGGVLVVGASTKSDRRAAYSNYGSGLDVLAPGGGSASAAACDSESQSNPPVVSTWWSPGKDDVYGAGCGSSMAVAHVSGIAALLMARGYSNTATVSKIKSTAVDLYGPGRDDQSGWGRVDAAAAVGATSASRPATKPKAKPKTSTAAKPGTVGAAGPKAAVKGTKIAPPSPPIAMLALGSAGPYDDRSDPKLKYIALALALSVGSAVSNTIARRRLART